ncbi:DCP2-domain-containing protein [Fistulina hepatica ATCC 64428]|uniref:DCP2-domain-containing protein n=1 Tax=Fistulina hepatica ATCC 64428 TaxID=1128425 RepID=A0A0D7ALU2_9AGAR|nr:DCP2-domain-containing protein [Fistulina hepatica ATCC 64428]
MSWYRSASQKDVLEDLASRFIVNLPTFELSSVERVCFQVEQAHWYYEDFVRPSNEKLPTIPLRKFTALMFKASELPYDPDEAFDTWMEYKTEVPVCGAIMLNDAMDKCVLVRGYKSASWTFPKGKLNQNEDTWHCACREVLEETGYHLAAKIQPDSVVTINHQGRQEMTMFIVTGVEEDASMLTRTRKEIDDIRWFRIDDLPHAGDRGKGHGGGKFYLVVPFMQFVFRLRTFENEHRYT